LAGKASLDGYLTLDRSLIVAKKPIPKKTSPAQVMSAAPAASIKAITAELPFAIIQYATNNSLLYPLDAAQGTTATLTLPAGSIQVIVHFAIKGQSCATFAPIHVASGNVADIPWQWISTCIGHTVLIWYEAVVGGKREESLVLELEIQDVREGDLRESMPEFVHAELEWGTRWLNMFKFRGDETIRVRAWPMIRAGSRLFIVVAGNEQNVPPLFKWVAFDHVVTEEEAHEGHVFEFELLRAWLARLDDYSSCTCHLGVIWDGCEPDAPVSNVNPLPRNAQDFHQRSTVLLRVDPTPDLLAPGIREAVDCGAAGWLINPTNTVSGAHLVIAYDGMAPGDVVCPHLSGSPGAGSPPFPCHTVQPGETSLVFLVPPSAISANFGKPVTASYTVSFNGLGPWSSPAFTATVLEPTEFPKPYIEEVTAGVLDLHTFNGDATAIVPIWDYAAVGQCVWVWITGTLEDGSTYLFYILMDKPLTAGWLANGVDAPISRAALQKLEDCSDFELHVAVSFDGKCDLKKVSSFDVQTFTIEQKNLVLDAPEVLEAVGKQLTIYNARNGMTVRVAYTRMSDKHHIQLNVKRADGTSIPLLPLPGDRNRGYVDFPIDRTEAIHASGKTLTINYTVTSACKIQTSKDLDLDVSEPVRLPTPKMVQATPPATQDGILDLRTFVGEAHISVDPWWFILTGQLYWLTCEGTKEDGSPYTITVSTREPIKNGDLSGLLRSLDRGELEKLRDKTQLKIQLKVTADGSNRVEDAIVFPELTLTLRKFYKNVTNFADGTLQGWNIGPGAPDPRDIAIERITGPDGLPGNAVRNFTYALSGNAGWVLQKRFNDLEVGYSYRFSVSVRSWTAHPVTPKLFLRKDSVQKTPIQALAGVGWYDLNFTFVANSQSAVLDIYNSEDQGDGNDWYMMYFTVVGV
jgi:hypothetical protein